MPIDKTKLYPMFEKSLRRNERLTDLATRKALDLPLDDDMQIITNNTRQGLGAIGTLFVSGVMLFSGAAGGFALLNHFSPVQENQATTELPAAQEFEVTFWTEDGQQLEVDANE